MYQITFTRERLRLENLLNLKAHLKKNDKVIQSFPHHLVFHIINQSFSNQMQIKVKYQFKDKLAEVYGFVSEFINNQVRIKSTDKIYLISIELIIDIS